MSAWTVIAHTEVGSGGAANITFSSIPSTYTDLLIMVNTRINEVNATGEAIYITLNGSTANFTNRYLQGDGASVVSGILGRYVASQSALLSTSNTFGNAYIYIPNYSSSQNKCISSDSVSENNANTAYSVIHSNLWSNTAAINEVILVAGTNDSFVQYSTATIYGITKGSSGGVTVS